MKSIYCYLLLGLGYAQAQETTGIQFVKGSWQEVLTAAQQAHKPVFVDLYTTWCGPCKLMVKQAFPDPRVGQQFNTNFINYQVDAEKGEGIELARHFGVKVYPTSLFVTAEGDLIYRAIGYSGIKGLMEEANKAIQAAKDPKPLAVYEQEYKAGRGDTAFLHGYLTKRAIVGEPNGEALAQYLRAIPLNEWTSAKNLGPVSGNLTTSGSEAYSVLYTYGMQVRMQDRHAYGKAMGGIKQANRMDYQQAVTHKNVSQLPKLMSQEQQYIKALVLVPPAEDELDRLTGLSYKLRFYRAMNDWLLYRSMAQQEGAHLLQIPLQSITLKDAAAYKKFEQDNALMPDSLKEKEDFKQYAASMQRVESSHMAMNLNSLAGAYSEMATNSEDLMQALQWSEKALFYDRTAAYLSTYANLCRRLGRKEQAIRSQTEAIEQAKRKGEDPTEYEKSLAQLRQMK